MQTWQCGKHQVFLQRTSPQSDKQPQPTSKISQVVTTGSNDLLSFNGALAVKLSLDRLSTAPSSQSGSSGVNPLVGRDDVSLALMIVG